MLQIWGVCDALATLSVVQQLGKGVVSAMMGAVPLRKRAHLKVPCEAWHPFQTLFSLEAYVPSFHCNHKTVLSDLMFFTLCLQENRSGETNSCVEEIIRVRIFF